ncbi:MAG TPA: DUF2782 domain-containing protein [Nitrococcus sp.]|nr:DUF2782 domain-containing protein [Nitrococcus sp.]
MRKIHPLVSAALVAALLGGAGVVAAADGSGEQVQRTTDSQLPRITPPPPPQELTKGAEIKPGVTIVHRNGAEFREYSVSGHIYAIRITPRWGPPYWLYDVNGSGALEEMYGDPLHNIPQTVQWKILTW